MTHARMYSRLVRLVLAALVLGTVAVTAPAQATVDSSRYICHATGNPSGYADVKKWVVNPPDPSGDDSGHAGMTHQNGSDIVPPTPGVLPNGWNWTLEGQQIWANNCERPTYVTVAAVGFTNQTCTNRTYVPPSLNAPSYTGIARTVTGLGSNNQPDPGETVTVRYQGSVSHIINGADSSGGLTSSHTYPASPASARDCVPQPEPVVHPETDTRTTCAGGVETRTWDIVRTYVWNQAQGQWVLGDPTVQNDTGYVFQRDLTAAEKVQLNCPRGPQPDAQVVPARGERTSCAGGLERRTWGNVTPYVFDPTTYTWVLGSTTTQENLTDWMKVRDLTAAEKLAADCPKGDPPDDEVVPGSDERSSCQTGALERQTWNDVTPYVFDDTTYSWVKGTTVREDVSAWTTVRELTPAEKLAADCPKGDPPDDEVLPRTEQRSNCQTGNLESRSWNDVTPYVFDDTSYTWVRGTTVVLDLSDWTTVRVLMPAEKVATGCPQGNQPDPVVEPGSDERSSCETGNLERQTWNDVTPYVFDPDTFTWVKGTTVREDVSAWTTVRELTPAEKRELECPRPPQPEDRVSFVSRDLASCQLGGTRAWTDKTVISHTFDDETWVWEETAPVTTEEQVVFTPYTPAERLDKCPTEVEGEEETDEGGDRGDSGPQDLEVRGAQTSAPVRTGTGTRGTAVPTAVDAGLPAVAGGRSEGDGNGAPLPVALGALLALIGLLTRRGAARRG